MEKTIKKIINSNLSKEEKNKLDDEQKRELEKELQAKEIREEQESVQEEEEDEKNKNNPLYKSKADNTIKKMICKKSILFFNGDYYSENSSYSLPSWILNEYPDYFVEDKTKIIENSATENEYHLIHLIARVYEIPDELKQKILHIKMGALTIKDVEEFIGHMHTILK